MKRIILIAFLAIALDPSIYSQINVAICCGFPDNCGAPLPNAGTYTACGTVNGKNAYCKGPDLKIIWTGSRWELQGRDVSVGGPFLAYWFSNDATTPDPPCTNWQAAFGCFPIVVTGGCIGAPPCVPPTISCPANITTTVASGTCAKTVTYIVITTGTPSPTITYAFSGATSGSGSGTGSGSSFNKGVTTVSVTADNGCNPPASCSFTITVNDNQAPMIVCPANTTIAANSSCQGTLGSYSPTSLSDNCNPSPTVTQSPASSTVLTGHNTAQVVTLTANDGNGNTASCTFTVTLKDISAPNITCPTNTTLAANSSCQGTLGSYSPTSLSDNCNPSPTVTQSPASSAVLTGHNTAQVVTLTANDGNGNTATCNLTVTLKDISAPNITCPANTTIAANSSCQGTLGSYSPASLSDNCNPSPTVTQSPASSTVLTGHNTAQVVTLTANDGNGNTSTCTLTVTLKDNTAPSITCPGDKSAVTLPGQCTLTGLAIGSPTGVGDNCAPPAPTVSNNAPSTYQLGITMVTWKATDANGNSKTCVQNVTLIPHKCGNPLQVYHTDTTATTAKIKWKAALCANSYQLRIRQEITPGVWGSWSSWVTSSGSLEHLFTGLNPGKFHHYQVRTLCGITFSATISDWFWTLPSFAATQDRSEHAGHSNIGQEIFENEMSLEFVPNPARDYTTVLIEGFELRDKTITMLDLYGKLVFRVKVDSKQNQLELDLTTLGVHTGVYLIRVSDDKKQKTKQLMIER